jgi:hypothetical protein
VSIPTPPRTETCPPPVCEIAPEPNTAVNLGAFLGESRDDGFPETTTATSERPPPFRPEVPRAPASLRTAAMLAAGLVLLVGAGVLAVSGRHSRASPTRGVTASQAAPTPTAVEPRSAEPCTAGETRVLARGVRLASGVEVGASLDRLAAAVTTSPLEARAVELDPTTLAVRSTARLATTRPSTSSRTTAPRSPTMPPPSVSVPRVSTPYGLLASTPPRPPSSSVAPASSSPRRGGTGSCSTGR